MKNVLANKTALLDDLEISVDQRNDVWFIQYSKTKTSCSLRRAESANKRSPAEAVFLLEYHLDGGVALKQATPPKKKNCRRKTTGTEQKQPEFPEKLSPRGETKNEKRADRSAPKVRKLR